MAFKTKLKKLFKRIIPGLKAAPGNIGQDKLFNDHDYFKQLMMTNKNGVIKALETRYTLVNPDYIEAYINHIYNEHLDNPQATLYIESELGAPQRQLNLVNQLNSNGYITKNKKCLDIGCNNGALVLACWKSGASGVMGIDISEKRLEKAKKFCQGKPIRIQNHNILENNIGETFDVILSTDVMEHVPDPGKLFQQLYTHLNKNKDAFIYLSLFNKYHTNNILSEPHFDIPGMILMPFAEAEELWHQVREDYKSKLDYEVYHWHSYWEYRQMAEQTHLDMIPFQNDAIISASIHTINNYKNISEKFVTAFKEKLTASPIPPRYRDKINGYVNAYLEEFHKEHEDFLATGPRDADQQTKIKYLFLKYHAQPLMMICKHNQRVS